jgi:hypothetical protein
MKTAALAIAAAALCGCIDRTPAPPQARACTEEARQCPDGSYVGRSGPDCAFICPAPAAGGMSVAPPG